VLRTIALWGLAVLTSITVIQRMVEVRRQTRPAALAAAEAAKAAQ
jgi:hypothetical protein